MLLIFINSLTTDTEKSKLRMLYEKYYGTMLSVAKGILIDHASAEDAVSDALETIIKNLHKIGDISCQSTRAYIVIISRSRAINIYNKQKKHPIESIDSYELADNSPNILDDLTMKESYDYYYT